MLPMLAMAGSLSWTTAEAALAQIAARGYVEPYRQGGKPVYSIGVVFGREERGIVDWQVVETA